MPGCACLCIVLWASWCPKINTACLGPWKAIISGVFTQTRCFSPQLILSGYTEVHFTLWAVLVMHQFSALHSYTPHKLQSPRGSHPRVRSCWAVRSTTNPASFPSLRHSPGLLAVPSLFWDLDLDRESEEQDPPGVCQGAAGVVTKGAVSDLLRALCASGPGCSIQACLEYQRLGPCQSYFMFSIALCLLQQIVKVITAHLFVLFTDKILFDHHILVPVADLPFPHKSFSTENL